MSVGSTGLLGGAPFRLAAGATGSNLTLNPLDATFIGWIGDSISLPITTNAPAQYGSSARLVANWAVSGAKWTNGDIPGQYATGFSNQTRIIIEGGINDIIAGQTAAALAAVVLAFVDARIAEGKQVVVNNVSPFAGYASWTAGLQAQLDAYNALLVVAVAARRNTKLLNLNALLADPANPLQLLPAYNSGDFLHPNTTGGAAWAAALAVLSP